MNCILKKCSVSLMPVYIVSVKRLLGTSTGLLMQQDGGTTPVDSPEVHQSNHQDQSNYETDLKTKILDLSLQFVPVHGWSKEAISAGAESLGYPGVIHGMFPKGGLDLIQHFYITSNKRLVDKLMEDQQDLTSSTSETQEKREDGSSRDKIEKAVRFRLEMIVPYIQQWPQALAIMSLPPNVPTSLANLLTLVDDIFYHTGDKSVDMSWYGRRVVLAGIYKATELYMLQDSSVQYTNTWQFLHRRMDEASQVRSYLLSSGQASQVAKEFATSAFITARSILGLSWNR